MKLALIALSLAISGIAAADDYDPLAAARVREKIGNVEAGIPPQCYAKTGAANPCYVCHTTARGNNGADDADLQQRYDFSPLRRTMPWTNQFVDRRAAIAKVSDEEILAWARADNYAPLRLAIGKLADYRGWKPDLDLEKGFDEHGFARDGSQWRAFRYKPFPGAFWPTNGSADEVMIRLPAGLREDAAGRFSREVYRANLAIVEAMIATPADVADAAIDRRIESIDERAAGIDLDGDGKLGIATHLRGLPARYAGRGDIKPRRGLYPQYTEFLHTVRYLDPQQPDYAARRLKELRYAIKALEIDDLSIATHYQDNAREKLTGDRPHYAGSALTGQSNDYGWTLSGYIEDAQGRLRLQTREEQLYCMGCHTNVGISVDQTFSLARKLPDAKGWGLQTLAGQRDAPQNGRTRGEYAEYFERARGGDDYRANREMLARFFSANGRPDFARIAGVDGSQGLRGLLLPSPQRALALNKAYREVVFEQSYKLGRDAVPMPLDEQVHRQLDQGDPTPKAADHRYDDAQLWLDWNSKTNR
ncbi:MAG: hypothetical protein JWQ90_1585 [Hydrocarboniphaga sp.]|uniref:hypothetical protein n=1 Tax=Hydrocarboniphaga sp. TaxID=2033016 RepID=UPI002622D643|nr:hypothetical protein [Hydrocarboniphaga sp.]MDB5969135.1 hypothetical protein [Hydrocarboniphaga sp.]